MNKFEKIRIRGYRRLLDVEIEMRPLTVMLGANGSGKTSFLEVWSLLAASCRNQLADKLSESGGLNDLLTRSRAQSLAFDATMSMENHAPLDYHVVIAPKGASYEIAEERLTQQNKPDGPPFTHIQSSRTNIRYYDVESEKLVRPTWNHDPLETSLAQVPKMFQGPEMLRERMASSIYYAPINVADLAPVRLPQRMRPATLPGTNGEYLVSCLYYLRETDRDRFEVIEDTLSAAFPDFERLEFPPVAAGTLAMTWKDKNFAKPFYMHELSEGTIRFLWLLCILQSRDLTAITLLDEPEVSLHPELLNLLADTMREAATRTQLIVATHSDKLVQSLRPEEILVADLEDGVTKFTWADSMDLERWLEDYTLDEIWQMGRLGGRS
ncbi:MAG: AAA family ATPase [Caldilineaceae bacterium]|jgi:predicted ATPase